MDDKLVLKNHLKEARTAKNLSQQEPADLVGVSRNTISSIETGQFGPSQTARRFSLLSHQIRRPHE
jgi:putative transcriptional regulator